MKYVIVQMGPDENQYWTGWRWSMDLDLAALFATSEDASITAQRAALDAWRRGVSHAFLGDLDELRTMTTEELGIDIEVTT